MGRCWTGYTSISGGMPGMTHSYRTHGLLATAWGHLFSYGYGLFEAQMPSEKIRWIRSLRGAECENKVSGHACRSRLTNRRNTASIGGPVQRVALRMVVIKRPERPS